MTEYELALQDYMQRLKGGFGNAMNTVGQGASMPLTTSMIGKGFQGIKGLLSGEEVGTGALGSDAESGFLKSLLGGNLEVNDANTGKVVDELEHLRGAGVTTNNASGTDPRMMVSPKMREMDYRAKQAGLLPGTEEYKTFFANFGSGDPMAGQDTMGSSFLRDSRMNVSNLGIGKRGLDTAAEREYLTSTMDGSQELLSSMTPDEANVYNQLEDFQKPAFLEALRQNKISQYEAENFDRLRM